MKIKAFNKKFLSFLDQSPTPFHAIRSMEEILRKANFTRLNENERWELKAGQPYYVVRDSCSLVAFNIGEDKTSEGFRITGAHSDSPCLQIKPNPDINDQSYHRLGVEVYGGTLLSPWFDRELSIAGRVCCRTEKDRPMTIMVDFNKPVAFIPSLAIHMDRNANKEKTINPQIDVNLLFGLKDTAPPPTFQDHLIAQIHKEHKNFSPAEILSYDLFCYDHQKAGYSGINDEFIVSGRLDNLLSCFLATHSISEGDKSKNMMFICNNHEEIGSTTPAGAQGNLAYAVFERLVPDPLERQITLARSFFISIDNAHAYHPNHPDKSDPNHKIILNHGPVLKINANKRYATSSFSNGLFKLLCREAKVPVQEFVMRNDMPCGSTIGPMVSSQLGLNTVDVGSASLGMHSIREITGFRDPFLMYTVIKHFYQKHEFSVSPS